MLEPLLQPTEQIAHRRSATATAGGPLLMLPEAVLQQPDSSQLQTTTQTDFWAEITTALRQNSAVDYGVVATDPEQDSAKYPVLEWFMSDHQRHTRDLAKVVQDYGETPATHADLRQVLTKGKVVISSLLGDRAILAAMRSNEDDTNKAYERAVSRTAFGKTIAQQTVTQERIAEALERQTATAEVLPPEMRGVPPASTTFNIDSIRKDLQTMVEEAAALAMGKSVLVRSGYSRPFAAGQQGGRLGLFEQAGVDHHQPARVRAAARCGRSSRAPAGAAGSR